jgi:hypothetical protein
MFRSTLCGGLLMKRRNAVKMLAACVGIVGLLVLPDSTSLAQSAQNQTKIVQRGLCVTCQPFGERCCALRPSIQACVQCGLSAGYNAEVQRAWCVTHQPRCARKR